MKFLLTIIVRKIDGVKSLFKPNEEGLYFYGQIKLWILVIVIVINLLIYLST